jgi:hypothetical protein
MSDPSPSRLADPFGLEPANPARLADALAAIPAVRRGPCWASLPASALVRQQLRRVLVAQLVADRARRGALALIELALIDHAWCIAMAIALAERAPDAAFEPV